MNEFLIRINVDYWCECDMQQPEFLEMRFMKKNEIYEKKRFMKLPSHVIRHLKPDLLSYWMLLPNFLNPESDKIRDDNGNIEIY